MRSVLVFLLLQGATIPAAVASQMPVQAVAVVAQAESAAPTAGAASAQTGTTSGLPQRDVPARTMRAYWHVFIAFAITWLLLFGFALSMGRRFGQLEEEVRRLRGSS